MKNLKELIKLKIFWCQLHTLSPTASYLSTVPIPYLWSYPESSVNRTNVTSNIFLTFPSLVLIISVFPLIGRFFSGDAIISLSSTSVWVV